MRDFIIGFFVGSLISAMVIFANDPYLKCKDMYDTPDDIIECVWILEQP
jgi:hypothetical protein